MWFLETFIMPASIRAMFNRLSINRCSRSAWRVDHAQEFFASLRVVGFAVGEQFDIGLDPGQRRFHFVADRGNEFGISLLTGFQLARVAEHGKSPGRLAVVALCDLAPWSASSGAKLQQVTVNQREFPSSSINSISPRRTERLAAASFDQQLDKRLAMQHLRERLADGRFLVGFEERLRRRIDQDQFVESVDRHDRFGQAGENRFDLLLPAGAAPQPHFQRRSRLLGLLQLSQFCANRSLNSWADSNQGLLGNSGNGSVPAASRVSCAGSDRKSVSKNCWACCCRLATCRAQRQTAPRQARTQSQRQIMQPANGLQIQDQPHRPTQQPRDREQHCADQECSGFGVFHERIGDIACCDVSKGAAPDHRPRNAAARNAARCCPHLRIGAEPLEPVRTHGGQNAA